MTVQRTRIMAAVSATAFLLLALALPIQGENTETTDCPEAPLTGSLSQDTTLAACVDIVEVTDGLSVSAELTITDSVVHLVGDAAQVRVVDGGLLTISGSTIISLAPVARITVEPGGRLAFSDADLQRSSAEDAWPQLRFEAGSTAEVQDTTLVQAAGTVVHVIGADAAFHGLDVVVASEDTAEILIEGAAEALFEQGDLGTSQLHAIGTASAAPLVRLHDTSHDPENIELEGPATLEVDWSVSVHVTAASPIDAATAALRIRDATGAFVVEDIPIDEDGRTDTILLPSYRQQGPDVTTQHEPFLFVAAHETSATYQTTALAPILASGGVIELAIPVDPDAEAPSWPTASADLRLTDDGAGATTDGTVPLEWTAADDTLDGTKPNRAVDHYRIHWGADDDHAVVQGPAITLSEMEDGLYPITVTAVDLVGNEIQSEPALVVAVDTTPPTVIVEVDVAENAQHAYNTTFNVTLTAEDALSDVVGFEHRVDGIGPFVDVDEPIEFTEEGTYVIDVVATDILGHRNETSFTFHLDQTTPVIQASLSPAEPDGMAGWYTERPQLVMSGQDDRSGILHTRWRLDDGPWTVYEEAVAVGRPGLQTLELQATDHAGNTARTQLVMQIDLAAPSIAVDEEGDRLPSGWYVSPAELHVNATDDASGIDILEHRRQGLGAWAPFASPLVIESSGVHDIDIRAVDASGNSSAVHTTVRVDFDPPVPPQVQWLVAGEGRVVVDWAQAPPLDLTSGLARVSVERADAQGVALGSRDAALNATSFTWSGLPTGDQRFRVVVADVATNTAATPWVELAVQGEPGAGVLGESSARIVRGPIVVAYAPTENVSVAEVRFYLDASLVHATADAPYEYQWDTRSATDGLHTVRVVAVDTAGLTHEEIQRYEVRNSYKAILEDHLVPLLSATVGLAVALALSTLSIVAWRRAELL